MKGVFRTQLHDRKGSGVPPMEPQGKPRQYGNPVLMIMIHDPWKFTVLVFWSAVIALLTCFPLLAIRYHYLQKWAPMFADFYAHVYPGQSITEVRQLGREFGLQEYREQPPLEPGEKGVFCVLYLTIWCPDRFVVGYEGNIVTSKHVLSHEKMLTEVHISRMHDFGSQLVHDYVSIFLVLFSVVFWNILIAFGEHRKSRRARVLHALCSVLLATLLFAVFSPTYWQLTAGILW